jgi:hypothetical protein
MIVLDARKLGGDSALTKFKRRALQLLFSMRAGPTPARCGGTATRPPRPQALARSSETEEL